MRAWASRCQSASTSGSIASASRGQPAPEQHVEPRHVLRRHGLAPVLEHGAAFRAGQREAAPGPRDLRRGLVVAAAGDQRVGEPQRAGAGLRRPAGEEGDHLGRRQARGHLALAGAAQGLQARASRRGAPGSGRIPTRCRPRRAAGSRARCRWRCRCRCAPPAPRHRPSRRSPSRPAPGPAARPGPGSAPGHPDAGRARSPATIGGRDKCRKRMLGPRRSVLLCLDYTMTCARRLDSRRLRRSISLIGYAPLSGAC